MRLRLPLHAVLMSASGAIAAPCLSGDEVAYDVFAEQMKVVATTLRGKPALFYDTPASGRCLLAKRRDGEDAFIDAVSARLPDQAPARAVSIIGEWVGGPRAKISIEQDEPGRLAVAGYASYSNARDAISTGEFHGFVASKEIETSKVGFQEDPQDKPSTRCFLQFRLVGPFLLVLDSGSITGSCGGQNVSFSGVYVKAE